MSATERPTKLSRLAPPKPSDAQVATVVGVIEGWPEADLVAWMDDVLRGTMMLSMTEDGLTQTACFGRDGQIQGDWF